MTETVIVTVTVNETATATGKTEIETETEKETEKETETETEKETDQARTTPGTTTLSTNAIQTCTGHNRPTIVTTRGTITSPAVTSIPVIPATAGPITQTITGKTRNTKTSRETIRRMATSREANMECEEGTTGRKSSVTLLITYRLTTRTITNMDTKTSNSLTTTTGTLTTTGLVITMHQAVIVLEAGHLLSTTTRVDRGVAAVGTSTITTTTATGK